MRKKKKNFLAALKLRKIKRFLPLLKLWRINICRLSAPWKSSAQTILSRTIKKAKTNFNRRLRFVFCLGRYYRISVIRQFKLRFNLKIFKFNHCLPAICLRQSRWQAGKLFKNHLKIKKLKRRFFVILNRLGEGSIIDALARLTAYYRFFTNSARRGGARSSFRMTKRPRSWAGMKSGDYHGLFLKSVIKF